MKNHLTHVLLIFMSLLPILINEGFETILFINNFYRLLLTLGVLYSCVIMYKYTIGRIFTYILVLLLTLNFSLSLVSRVIYKSNFDETQATSILLSNSSESLGMLQGYLPYILISILYFVVLVSLIQRISKQSFSVKQQKGLSVFVIVNFILLNFLALDSYVLKGEKRKFNKSSNTTKFLQKIPLYNSARFVTALNFMDEAKAIHTSKVDYSDLKVELNNIENIVVVIGESARKDVFSLYGATTKTSPNLDKRKGNMMIFENAIAPASYTILAVPMLLSKAVPSDNYSPLEVSDNIVNMANHTYQWNTYWFSSHEKIGIHVNAISAIADFAKTRDWNENKYDEYLVPMLRESINDSAHKRLIFLHTIGSHYPLTDRYPKEFDVFKSFEKQYYNEYYNSIYYTDYVIEQVIKEIENTPSILIYVSDHAQTDNKTMFTHSLTKKGVEVPFFIWYSDSVEDKFKITTTVSERISTTEVYEIIKRYLGVKTSNRKAENKDLKVLSGDMKLYTYDELEEQ